METQIYLYLVFSEGLVFRDVSGVKYSAHFNHLIILCHSWKVLQWFSIASMHVSVLSSDTARSWVTFPRLSFPLAIFMNPGFFHPNFTAKKTRETICTIHRQHIFHTLNPDLTYLFIYLFIAAIKLWNTTLQQRFLEFLEQIRRKILTADFPCSPKVPYRMNTEGISRCHWDVLEFMG